MRLVARSPAPAGWLPGWPPKREATRCRCGARIVSVCSRFTSCERGCVHLFPEPPRPVPEPPRPPARERANFAKLIVDLRLMERRFVRNQLRGRPSPAAELERAFTAMELLWELCPGHGAEILAALPWLTKQAGKGRAA